MKKAALLVKQKPTLMKRTSVIAKKDRLKRKILLIKLKNVVENLN